MKRLDDILKKLLADIHYKMQGNNMIIESAADFQAKTISDNLLKLCESIDALMQLPLGMIWDTEIEEHGYALHGAEVVYRSIERLLWLEHTLRDAKAEGFMRDCQRNGRI